MHSVHSADNQLLAQLDPEKQGLIRPKLKLVTLTAGSVIHGSGQACQHVYLPVSSLCYQIQRLDNGTSSGFAIIGNEGMISPYALIGDTPKNCEFAVLKSGTAFQLPVEEARHFLGFESDRYQPILGFITAWKAQVTQAVVFSRERSTEQQLCRWILIASQLTGDARVGLSQEFATLMGMAESRFRALSASLQLQGAFQMANEQLVVEDYDLVKRLGEA